MTIDSRKKKTMQILSLIFMLISLKILSKTDKHTTKFRQQTKELEERYRSEIKNSKKNSIHH